MKKQNKNSRPFFWSYNVVDHYKIGWFIGISINKFPANNHRIHIANINRRNGDKLALEAYMLGFEKAFNSYDTNRRHRRPMFANPIHKTNLVECT